MPNYTFRVYNKCRVGFGIQTSTNVSNEKTACETAVFTTDSKTVYSNHQGKGREVI